MSCISKQDDKSVAKNQSKDSTTKNILKSIDTLTINNQNFIQTLQDDRFNCLTSVNGDSIIKSQDYYFKAELIDINEDGYTDIRVFVFSNTPNECENYLFDKNFNTFKQIENSYLNIEKIKGTNFYFSYNRAGCADQNWESHLSKIENWKEVTVGEMIAYGCGEKDDRIEIYRVVNEKDRKLIKTLPILDYKKVNKWGFLEDYWTKNYKKFQ